jgi:predicted phage tail component-like protein
MKWGTVDLTATYDMTVRQRNPGLSLATDYAGADLRAWGFRSKAQPAHFSLDVIVTGSSLSDLDSNLSSIRGTLSETEDAELRFDENTDRYWLARFVSLSGSYRGPNAWVGQLELVCHDPAAYAEDEDTATDTAAASWSDLLTVGGTTYCFPVITLTADGAQADITVVVRNDTLDMELSWTGTLANEDVLEFDSETESVTLNAASAMTGVAGDNPRWPLLKAGDNLVEITGFTGTVLITWRERYL